VPLPHGAEAVAGPAPRPPGGLSAVRGLRGVCSPRPCLPGGQRRSPRPAQPPACSSFPAAGLPCLFGRGGSAWPGRGEPRSGPRPAPPRSVPAGAGLPRRSVEVRGARWGEQPALPGSGRELGAARGSRGGRWGESCGARRAARLPRGRLCSSVTPAPAS